MRLEFCRIVLGIIGCDISFSQSIQGLEYLTTPRIIGCCAAA